MNPSAEQLQVWLDDPVTKWITQTFANDIAKIEAKLQETRFKTLEDVIEVQVTLDCAKRWVREPERRLQALIKSQQQKPEDEAFG